MDSNRFDRVLVRDESLYKPEDDLTEFIKRAGYECDSAIDDSIDFEFQPKLRQTLQTVHVRNKRNKAKTAMQRKSRKKNRKG